MIPKGNTAKKYVPKKVNPLAPNNDSDDDSDDDSGTDLGPSNPLTLPNPTAPDGTNPPDERFILFSRDWLQLQTFIASGLKLPISQDEFGTKYGAFDDADLVTGAVSSMQDVQALSTTFGDPKTIKEKIQHDGTYLSSAEPPEEIYGHIIWLAGQIQDTASTFGYTYAQFQRLLDPQYTPDASERAKNLRELLDGEGGLSSMATKMGNKVSTLSEKLADFDIKFDTASDGLKNYTDKGTSVLMIEAGAIITDYQTDIDGTPGHPGLIDQADAAHDSWRDYTIAAVSAAVAIIIYTGGIAAPVAAAVGGGLGAKAQTFREKYNLLMDKISHEEEEIQKKVRLILDLTGYSGLMPKVKDAITSFKTDLALIEGVWIGIGQNFSNLAANADDDQLSSYSWVMQQTSLTTAQNKWHDIADTTKVFTQNSLIDVEEGPEYPNDIGDQS